MAPQKASDGGLGTDYFISFVQADEAWADWITGTLAAAGKSVATGREAVAPGSSWELSLKQALGEARELLVVVASRTAGSSGVRAEAALARASAKPVTAVVVDASAQLPADLAGATVVNLADAPVDVARRKLIAAMERPESDEVIDAKSAFEPPPELPTTFVNRHREMELLEKTFLGEHSSTPATVVLTGPAGIGKTALAAVFAQRHQRDFEAIHWLKRWRGPIDIGPDQMEHGSKGSGRELLIVDDADNYESVANILSSAGPAHVLLASRTQRWGRPFQVVELGPLDPEASVQLLQRILPGIEPSEAQQVVDAIGGQPYLLGVAAEIARKRSPLEFLGDYRVFNEALRAATRERQGYYYLDTDDPRAISDFERALEEILGQGRPGVELLDRQRGSWRRWWQRRYTPDRVDAIADKAERAAEVAALVKPEGEANRSNAEAIARLIEVSNAIPNLVVISGSVLLIKVTDEHGSRVVSKTLTATELRRFEERDELLADPVRALEALQAGGDEQKQVPSG
jgi:hypothetical protein